MSKQFVFRIEGDQKDFRELLEKNHIPYTTKISLRHRQRRIEQEETEEEREKSTFIRPDLTFTFEGVAIDLAIALTPFALDKIWNWYKEKRKRKDSQLSVFCGGNLLDLDARSKKILMKALTVSSEVKKRRKRGEPK